MQNVLFILGSGSSVDSGLFTYRDSNKYNNIATLDDDVDTIWEKLLPIFCKAKECNCLSNTYKIINDIMLKNPNSYILTQNIDGLIKQIKTENIIELHGNINYMKCKKCNLYVETDVNKKYCICSERYYPMVTLYGETLTFNLGRTLKKPYKYVLVIGTSLQFQYLRDIINKCKSKGSKVIHINPDFYYNTVIRKNEIFIQKNAYEGLLEFVEKFMNN